MRKNHGATKIRQENVRHGRTMSSIAFNSLRLPKVNHTEPSGTTGFLGRCLFGENLFCSKTPESQNSGLNVPRWFTQIAMRKMIGGYWGLILLEKQSLDRSKYCKHVDPWSETTRGVAQTSLCHVQGPKPRVEAKWDRKSRSLIHCDFATNVFKSTNVHSLCS